MKTKYAIYLMARFYSAFLGAFLIVGFILLSIYPIQIEVPPPIKVPLTVAPWFLMSVIVLIPNYLTQSTMLFRIRLALYVISSVCLLIFSINNIYIFRKSVIDMLATLPFIILAFTLPLNLFLWKKYFAKSY